MGRTKAPDEVFCTSCGEPIKKKAEICPGCGVRNDAAATPRTDTSRSSRGTEREHDPADYETTVGETWWYGIALGLFLWAFVFVFTSVDSGVIMETVLGLVTLLGWAIMPVAIYFDTQYVRANSTWNPNTVLWVVLMVVWVVNIIGGGAYLYRRHEVLGEP